MQSTNYPWNGAVRITVAPRQPTKFTLRLRIPSWVQGRPVPSDLYAYEANAAPSPNWSVRVAGESIAAKLDSGYVAHIREWQAGDTVELELPMPVHAVRGHANITATAGRVAFERGPIVYCVEAIDGKIAPADLVVPSGALVEPVVRPELLGGSTVLRIRSGATEVEAIPYFAWNNRGLAPMAVWLKRD